MHACILNTHTAKNATDLMQVVDFSGLMQSANKLYQQQQQQNNNNNNNNFNKLNINKIQYYTQNSKANRGVQL